MFGIPAIELVGLVAGFLSVCSIVPQSLRILKAHTALAVSGKMYMMLLSSYLLWIIYGVMADAYSIIFWYTIGAILAAFVLVLKFYYNWKEE